MTPTERVVSLDVLRGFALLGIFVMNVQSMSMIGPAYFNPTSYGDLTGINYAVWYVSHLLADQKFMTIFSILFGAGIVIFAERAVGRSRSPAGLHYRRVFWLLCFGLLHAYLIWYGDILVPYAVCAMIVYPLRRLPPVWLGLLAFGLLGMGSAIYLLLGWSLPYQPPEQIAAIRESLWLPSPEGTAAELEAYRGGFAAQMEVRPAAALMIQTQAFLVWTFWRVAGLMLAGMALWKTGVLSARRSPRFYALMAGLGLLLGIPLVAQGVAQHAAHGWRFEYSFYFASQYNYWGSLLVSTGYIGALLWLMSRVPSWSAWRPLAAVGRTAFSNYILQSLLGTFIFYGHGLGLYGGVERWGQALIVLAVWTLQLTVSTHWMRRFAFGPLEWLWRSLSYWRLQRWTRATA